MRFAASPEQVVFDFASSNPSAFQGMNGYTALKMTDIGTAAALAPPSSIGKYASTFPTHSYLPFLPVGGAFLFMHEMSGANKTRYLVIAFFSLATAGDGGDPDPKVDGRVGLSATYFIVQPGTWQGFASDPVFGCPKQTSCYGLDDRVTFPYGNLRVFAGQIDPGDPTHFTVRFQCQGKAGILDGFLRDDGSPSGASKAQEFIRPGWSFDCGRNISEI